MTSKLIAVALVMLLAGCVSPGEGSPASSAAARREATPTPTAAAYQTSLDTDNASAAPAKVDFLWEGNVPGIAALCAQDLECVFLAGPHEAASSQLSCLAPTTGNITRASLTLEWTPAAPTTQELAFALFNVSMQDSEDIWARITPWARGTSPLTLDTQDLKVAPNERVAILVVVPPVYREPAPAWAFATLDQPFELTGTIMATQRTTTNPIHIPGYCEEAT